MKEVGGDGVYIQGLFSTWVCDARPADREGRCLQLWGRSLGACEWASKPCSTSAAPGRLPPWLGNFTYSINLHLSLSKKSWHPASLSTVYVTCEVPCKRNSVNWKSMYELHTLQAYKRLGQNVMHWWKLSLGKTTDFITSAWPQVLYVGSDLLVLHFFMP